PRRHRRWALVVDGEGRAVAARANLDAYQRTARRALDRSRHDARDRTRKAALLPGDSRLPAFGAQLDAHAALGSERLETAHRAANQLAEAMSRPLRTGDIADRTAGCVAFRCGVHLHGAPRALAVAQQILARGSVATLELSDMA